MDEILIKILVCFLAGAGAGIGTGFAGMSAAAVIGPMLITFLGVPAYDAVGIGLISDVLASFVSAYTYKRSAYEDRNYRRSCGRSNCRGKNKKIRRESRDRHF